MLMITFPPHTMHACVHNEMDAIRSRARGNLSLQISWKSHLPNECRFFMQEVSYAKYTCMAGRSPILTHSGVVLKEEVCGRHKKWVDARLWQGHEST